MWKQVLADHLASNPDQFTCFGDPVVSNCSSSPVANHGIDQKPSRLKFVAVDKTWVIGLFLMVSATELSLAKRGGKMFSRTVFVMFATFVCVTAHQRPVRAYQSWDPQAPTLSQPQGQFPGTNASRDNWPVPDPALTEDQQPATEYLPLQGGDAVVKPARKEQLKNQTKKNLNPTIRSRCPPNGTTGWNCKRLTRNFACMSADVTRWTLRGTVSIRRSRTTSTFRTATALICGGPGFASMAHCMKTRNSQPKSIL